MARLMLHLSRRLWVTTRPIPTVSPSYRHYTPATAGMKAKKWVIGTKFQGEPKDENLQLVEEELPALQDGDVLLEALCWSVDPYMRPRVNFLKPGHTMAGQHIAKVIESRNSKYPVGKLVGAGLGWRTHSVCNPDKLRDADYQGSKVPVISEIPDLGGAPTTAALGVLGLTGATAHLGLMEICNPQPGETVLVNGAAGAVGSIVGQIARIKGCNVIGFAGTADKVKYLKDELGFHHAFNYKTDNISKCLSEAAPNGIDCYFDNVGGTFSTQVIVGHMNTFGRMAICGVISRYNEDMMKPAPAPELYGIILFKQMRVEGFIVHRWFDKFPKAFSELSQWIKEDKLKYREHKTEGFDQMRSAFYGMLKGENTGKAIIVPKSNL